MNRYKVNRILSIIFNSVDSINPHVKKQVTVKNVEIDVTLTWRYLKLFSY